MTLVLCTWGKMRVAKMDDIKGLFGACRGGGRHEYVACIDGF